MVKDLYVLSMTLNTMANSIAGHKIIAQKIAQNFIAIINGQG
jgi:hypothetical protein